MHTLDDAKDRTERELKCDGEECIGICDENQHTCDRECSCAFRFAAEQMRQTAQGHHEKRTLCAHRCTDKQQINHQYGHGCSDRKPASSESAHDPFGTAGDSGENERNDERDDAKMQSADGENMGDAELCKSGAGSV